MQINFAKTEYKKKSTNIPSSAVSPRRSINKSGKGESVLDQLIIQKRVFSMESQNMLFR